LLTDQAPAPPVRPRDEDDAEFDDQE